MSSSMANVKSVIALLCKHINLSINLNLKPEHFRLAKFDKTDENVVCEMWNILEHTISILPRQKINILSSCAETNAVNRVKQYFALLNYDSIDFYCLPADMTQGSRTLLLAFAWLVLTENILERLLVQKLRNSLLNQEFYDQNMIKDHPPEKTQNGRTGPLDHELNYILWVAGKIDKNMRDIDETGAKRLDLTAQVHSGSMHSCGLPHVSVTEARLAREPELLDNYLAEVEPDAQLLETHRQWRSKATVFWEWMESVVEEEQKCEMSPRIDIGRKRSLAQFVDYLRFQLNSSVQKIEREEPSISHEESNGVGRLLLTSDKQIKLNEWLDSAEEQVGCLELECVKKSSGLKEELNMILDQMKGIEIISG